MRVRHKRTLACRILLAVLLLVIIVCAAAGGIWLSAMHSLGKHAVCGTDSGYETDGCVLEDTVLYHGKTYRRVEIKIYNSYNSNVSGTSTDDTGTETPADAALSTETVTDTPEAATTGATVEPTEVVNE